MPFNLLLNKRVPLRHLIWNKDIYLTSFPFSLWWLFLSIRNNQAHNPFNLNLFTWFWSSEEEIKTSSLDNIIAYLFLHKKLLYLYNKGCLRIEESFRTPILSVQPVPAPFSTSELSTISINDGIRSQNEILFKRGNQ